MEKEEEEEEEEGRGAGKGVEEKALTEAVTCTTLSLPPTSTSPTL